MKKVLIIVTIIAILVGMTGCGMVQQTSQSSSSNGQSLATATPASVTTTTVAVPVSNPVNTVETDNDKEPTGSKVSTEEMWSDLSSYAEKYLTNEWDGSEVYRSDYFAGKIAYAKVNHGWLDVGCWRVIPGATISDTSVESLVMAYENGVGWVHHGSCYWLWSQDYRTQYVIDSYGWLEEWNHDISDPTRMTVVDAEIWPGECFEYDELAERVRNGTWNGERIWCPNSDEVLQWEDIAYGINCAGVDTYRYGFPALDENLPHGYGYYDTSSSLTVAITENGAGLYQLDGSPVAYLDGSGDDWYAAAFVAAAGPEALYGADDTTYVYVGGTTVYAVDFDHGTFVPAYTNAEYVWFGWEHNLTVKYHDEWGALHTVTTNG